MWPAAPALQPTSGDIYIQGQKADIRNTTDAIKYGIETIYQDSALVTQLSIARNLFLGREPIKEPKFLNRMDQAMMNEVAGQLLKRVGISKDIPPTTPISSLSGGERQAVAIARAMHFDSELIILDEPTSGLDPEGVRQLRDVIVALNRDLRMTIFMNTHLLSEVTKTCTSIGILRQGELAYHASLEATLQAFPGEDSLEEIYLNIRSAPAS